MLKGFCVFIKVFILGGFSENCFMNFPEFWNIFVRLKEPELHHYVELRNLYEVSVFHPTNDRLDHYRLVVCISSLQCIFLCYGIFKIWIFIVVCLVVTNFFGKSDNIQTVIYPLSVWYFIQVYQSFVVSSCPGFYCHKLLGIGCYYFFIRSFLKIIKTRHRFFCVGLS